MTAFPYRLSVLTHAAGGETLALALAAFEEHSDPAPTDVLVVVDGPEFGYVTEALECRFGGAQITIHTSPRQEGFCAATRRAWALAAAGPGPQHVAWLEHDFELTRDVPWVDLAAVLDANPQLSQMALMRQAVNAAEKAAGGLFESRPGEYEPRIARCSTCNGSGDWGTDDPEGYEPEGCPGCGGDGAGETWHEHSAYVMTTNPSLMRRSFMQAHPWPDYAFNCEGLFGLDLAAAGFSAGVYGDGSPWCSHVGVRSGVGY